MVLPVVLLSVCLFSTNPDRPPTTDVAQTAESALAKLPGQTAFLFTEIGGERPKPLYAVRADERFAIGSSFKLFILGTLAEEVNADRRGLDNVMLLAREWIGPPHSEMSSWPIGSPVTLHTLSLKMISISDNTATDHLLHLLGREQVEAQMERMGHSHPQWNRPLLSTREMTMLRDRKTGVLGGEYQRLDEPARRKFLADRFAGRPDYDKLDFDTAAFGLAEWYATPQDMASALVWLKNNSGVDEPAHPLRAVLAIETKLPHDPAVWPYVGFKGGSEDQVLAGNWLLQHRDGRWYTMHLFWNNPDGPADPQKMIETIGVIFGAIERSLR